MKYVLILFCLCFLSFGCNSNTPPENVLNEDTYVNVLIELQLLQSYQYQQQANSSAVDSLQKVIFHKYDTNEAQFQVSHQYYQQDIEKQRDRLGVAVEELRKDQLAAQDSLAKKDSARAK